MVSRIETRTLGELVSDARGISYGIVQPGPDTVDGVPIVRVCDINGDSVNTANLKRVSSDIAAKYSRTCIRGGELLVSVVGTPGLCVIASQELKGSNLARAIAMVPIEDGLLTRWCRYQILSSAGQQYIEQCLNTTVQKTLNLKELAAMPIPVPSREVMAKSIQLLDSIERLTCANQRTNDYLVETVRVEFERRFGQEAPTIDLGDVLTISTKSLKPSDCIGEVWEHYSIPAYDESHRPVFEPAEGIKSNKYVIDNNCILISKLNPSTKRLWLPCCTSARPVCSTEFIVYKPKRPEHKSFYYAAIDSSAFTDFLLAHVTGSTGSRQRTHPKATLGYPMPNPGVREIDEFCEFADPLIAKWQLNEQESAKLERLRDALLPRLMSGEIDVSQIELPTQPNNHLG